MAIQLPSAPNHFVWVCVVLWMPLAFSIFLKPRKIWLDEYLSFPSIVCTDHFENIRVEFRNKKLRYDAHWSRFIACGILGMFAYNHTYCDGVPSTVVCSKPYKAFWQIARKPNATKLNIMFMAFLSFSKVSKGSNRFSILGTAGSAFTLGGLCGLRHATTMLAMWGCDNKAGNQRDFFSTHDLLMEVEEDFIRWASIISCHASFPSAWFKPNVAFLRNISQSQLRNQ